MIAITTPQTVSAMPGTTARQPLAKRDKAQQSLTSVR